MASEHRLIDANALAVEYRKCDAEITEEPWLLSDILEFLNAAPTVDAVEVVRCQKCEFHREDGGICVNPKCGKSWYGCPVPPNHYCSYGERRCNK